MREIDVAHQAEDQREAAGDEEIEAAQRDPVERGVEKQLLLAEHRLEARAARRRRSARSRRRSATRMMSDQTGWRPMNGSCAAPLMRARAPRPSRHRRPRCAKRSRHCVHSPRPRAFRRARPRSTYSGPALSHIAIVSDGFPLLPVKLVRARRPRGGRARAKRPAFVMSAQYLLALRIGPAGRADLGEHRGVVAERLVHVGHDLDDLAERGCPFRRRRLR